MKYKELFDYINNSNDEIIINSYLNLINFNSISENLIQDSETKNIFQFNGEIYNSLNEITKDLSEDNKDNDNKTLLFKILNNFSKNNKIEDKNKYLENFFLIYNNLESDHAFYFHDNINNQILISRDLFGKRSIILSYINFNKI